MKCEIPLTPEQKIFAAQNHDLVYKFLQKKNLPIDEYYDVVIFGYLRSVYRFFTEPQLQQYAFGTLAWKGMLYSLNNYKKGIYRQKRNAEVFSIHSELDDENSALEEILTPRHPPFPQVP